MATANEIASRRRAAEAASQLAAKKRQEVVQKNAPAKPMGGTPGSGGGLKAMGKSLLGVLTNAGKNIGTAPAPMSADAKQIKDKDDTRKALRDEVGGR